MWVIPEYSLLNHTRTVDQIHIPFATVLVSNEQYTSHILEPLYDELTYTERLTGCFQQDNATAHTANESMTELRHVFCCRIISKELWPTRSPDLTPNDFYFWGRMKNRVYETNPHVLEELKENIRTIISSISAQELVRMNDAFLLLCKLCTVSYRLSNTSCRYCKEVSNV